jgi:site-specific recombinase XerD
MLIAYTSFLKVSNAGKGSQINKLIRVAIKALIWIQDNGYARDRIVGTDGRSPVTISSDKQMVRSGFMASVISHPCMVENSFPTKVHPISISTVDKLFESVPKLLSDRGLQRRMDGILDMLLNSGGRRSEVSSIQVSDVKSALRDAGSGGLVARIRLNCAKGGIKWEPRIREIPIKLSSLERLNGYIDFDRALIIERAIERGRIATDHGALWINCWGKPMNDQTISDYVRLLRVRGGIAEAAWPHMFRHRALTLLALEIISQLKRSGIAINDVLTTLLLKLASFSGHRDPSSVQVYFDVAFDESEAFTEADRKFVDRFSRDENSLCIARLKRAVSGFKSSKSESTLIELEDASELLVETLRRYQQSNVDIESLGSVRA